MTAVPPRSISSSLLRSLLGQCRHAQCGAVQPQSAGPLWALTLTRGSRNWKRKVLQREDRKEDVVDYVGKNPRRADRVYAWGCAATGALEMQCGRNKATALIKEMAREESACIRERMKRGPFTVSTDGSNDGGTGSKQFPLVVRTINEKTGLVESQLLALPVCNESATGISSYMRPDKNQKPMVRQLRPARVKFIDENHLRPYLVSCGYGFTVLAVKSQQGLMLLGTGINTSSQLGFHEQPRKSGRVLDYIIQPLKMSLPVSQPQSTQVKSIGCGRAHTVVVTDGAGVFSLGHNGYGQCGRPIVQDEQFSKNPIINTIEDLPEDIKEVTCGQDHTIFTTSTGKLYACGMGSDGQTGQGHYDQISIPSPVKGDVEGETIVGVHGRADCVLALSDKGDVFGWGNSEYMQLATVTDESQIHTARHLPLSQCGRVVKAVAGGSICAVLNDQGQVFVWGYGILGKGPELESSSAPTMIPETLFGRNELQPDTRVVDIECGLGHFVALTNKGDVYSWGHNKEGCLGLGINENHFFPFKVSIPAEAHTVVCGVDHTIALCKSFM